jgi:hypothetical protein
MKIESTIPLAKNLLPTYTKQDFNKTYVNQFSKASDAKNNGKKFLERIPKAISQQQEMSVNKIQL